MLLCVGPDLAAWLRLCYLLILSNLAQGLTILSFHFIGPKKDAFRLADKIPVALEAPGVATNLPATGILSASLGDSSFCVKLLPILYQRTEGRDGRMT